jgi:putative ABC transport system permease protein
VAEVVSGGNAFAYQFAWANASDVTALSGAQGFTSYFLVTTQGGDAKAVGQRIVSTVPDTQVFVGQELADKNADNLRQGFLPVLLVLVVVAFVVGTAIIGLIIYTATVEKTREYGVLKAIGFSNRRLYAVVFQQSLLAATAGFVAGCLLSVVLGPAIERIVPVFVTEIRWGDILFAGVGALGMAIVASFVPARPMARLDPAEVFRA